MLHSVSLTPVATQATIADRTVAPFGSTPHSNHPARQAPQCSKADIRLALADLLANAVEEGLGLAPQVSYRGLPRWRLQRALYHIEANISGRLKVAELAAVAQMSVSHFSRGFRESMGQSPHSYVTGRRVAAAMALIAEDRHPLAEIAIMCGAADQAHLNRLFARCCGLTPGAWRRLAQEQGRHAAAPCR